MTSLNWKSKKPKFKQDCLLVTASWRSWSKNPVWEYQFFEIVRTNCESGEGWYWGIISDDQEWGDIDNLNADYYAIIQPRKPLPKKREKALAARN